MITINLEIVLTVLSIIAAVVALAGYWHQRRALIMSEGKAAARIEGLIADVSAQKQKILDIEAKAHCFDMDNAEKEKDIKYLVEAVKRIEARLDLIAPPTVKHD